MGPATDAVTTARGLSIDQNGDLYVVDDERVRRINHATGIVTSVVGNGQGCSAGATGVCGDGGLATNAWVSGVSALAFDSAGDLYLSDLTRVRKVTLQTGIISAYAGTGNFCLTDTCGDGAAAVSVGISQVGDLAFDSLDNLFVVGSSASAIAVRVRRVDRATHLLSTIAGTATACAASNVACGDGGQASVAQFAGLSALAMGPNGDIALADDHSGINASSRVRVIDSLGVINTAAGSGSTLLYPTNAAPTTAILGASAAAIDASGNLFVTSPFEDVLFRVDPAKPELVPFAGITQVGLTSAPFGSPATSVSVQVFDVAVDSLGNVFITDATGIRRIDHGTGIIDTIAGGTTNCTDATTSCGDGNNALLADVRESRCAGHRRQ